MEFNFSPRAGQTLSLQSEKVTVRYEACITICFSRSSHRNSCKFAAENMQYPSENSRIVLFIFGGGSSDRKGREDDRTDYDCD